MPPGRWYVGHAALPACADCQCRQDQRGGTLSQGQLRAVRDPAPRCIPARQGKRCLASFFRLLHLGKIFVLPQMRRQLRSDGAP